MKKIRIILNNNINNNYIKIKDIHKICMLVNTIQIKLEKICEKTQKILKNAMKLKKKFLKH